MEEFHVDRFAPHVGTLFQIEVIDGEPIILELIEAETIQAGQGAPRQDPFSLMFRGSADLRLPQATYVLQHPVLGTIELFLIPRQPDDGGSYFEAIFN